MTASSAKILKVEADDKKSKRFVSLESFLQRYTNREDGFKYEWNNGIIEKTPRTMNRDQSIIQEAILAYFYANPTFRKHGGFIVELDMLIPSSNRTRRADMAFLSRQQMLNSKNGDLSVPEFVIEVISTHDKINEVEKKLNEYFDNGVKVVWQILPLTETVKVYISSKDVKICRGGDICSAETVIPEFLMKAEDVFN